MVLFFMEHGHYTNRAKARSRYIQQILTEEEIQKEFQEKVSLAKQNLDHDVNIQEETIAKTGPAATELPDRVFAQKQPGLYAVKYHPICGNMDL